MTSRVSRSTTSLDSVDLSRSSKLDRLSKAYSLTDLSARPRRRTSSSDSLYSKGTASSRSKSQIGNEDSAKSRNLSRLTKNIEKDRNSEEKFSAAYREKWKGIMNQTSSRSETKKRDSALLSGTKPRLPTLNDKNPRQNGVTRSKAPVSNGGRARSGKPDLEMAGARNGEKLDTGRARSRSSKPDLSTGQRKAVSDHTTSKPDLSTGQRKAGSDHTTSKPGRDNAKLGGGGKIGGGKVEESRPGGKKGFAGAVSRAAPTKTLAGTVKRATLANGQRTKQVDDFTLNKKYSESVCEPCKLQIHEKLKRGYTKYKSLDTMKACEKCKRVVIDFDFYQICIECAKSTAVCAKCASGSTKMTGARFVEVVRHGVEENILAMNSNELKKFAEKHAKIDIVERKIEDIEQLDDAKVLKSLPNSRKTSGKSSRGSSVGSPSVRKISAKLNSPTRSTPSTKAATIARSLTSSSSPLVDKDGRHSGNESDEAYISGHISSTEIVKSASDPVRKFRRDYCHALSSSYLCLPPISEEQQLTTCRGVTSSHVDHHGNRKKSQQRLCAARAMVLNH